MKLPAIPVIDQAALTKVLERLAGQERRPHCPLRPDRFRRRELLLRGGIGARQSVGSG
jgi:hypothetical protein